MTTTETEHRHEWDGAVDSGGGWTDQLVSQWAGQAVYVTRNIASPEAQVEHIRIVFPDGSRLYLGVDGREPVERALETGQAEHWTQVPHTDAYRASEPWIQSLYDLASIKEVDTDL